MQILPKTFTITQAAEVLQVSPSTIRRMLKQKDFHFVRVNRSIRIPTIAIEAFLQEKNNV